MEKGVLSGERLTCPWHAACYNVETGDIEDGPGFDKLPVYVTEVDSAGELSVLLPDAVEKFATKVAPHVCPASVADQRSFVIIGSGPCAQAAVETLRSEGFGGRITMLSKEGSLPYDRTKLSKNMAVEPEELVLRPAEWYKTASVAMRQAVVTAVRTVEREVVIEGGEVIKYDRLLCASGGPARTFRPGEGFVTPGAESSGIFPLREGVHSKGIEDAFNALGPKKARVVIVGSSFIGMEAAAYLVASKKAEHVTVVGMESEPFERVLGPAVGRYMRETHEAKGVQFEMRAKVLEFEAGPRTKAVKGVRVEIAGVPGFRTIDADIVILGAGIIPAVEYLKASAGVTLLARAPGGVEVDSYLGMAGSGAAPDVYAAGDIAYFPYSPPGSAAPHGTRIEHWDVAIDQGRVAARNMLGQRVRYGGIPFFWTSAYGKSLRYAGHALSTADVILHGELKGEGASFVAYYVVDGRVAAVAAWNREPFGVAALELLRAGAMPAPEVLRAVKDFDLVAALHAHSRKA